MACPDATVIDNAARCLPDAILCDFQSFMARILGRYVAQCRHGARTWFGLEVELRVKSCSAGVFVVGQDSPVAAPLASIAAGSWEITRIPRRRCPRLAGIAVALGLGAVVLAGARLRPVPRVLAHARPPCAHAPYH